MAVWAAISRGFVPYRGDQMVRVQRGVDLKVSIPHGHGRARTGMAGLGVMMLGGIATATTIALCAAAATVAATTAATAVASACGLGGASRDEGRRFRLDRAVALPSMRSQRRQEQRGRRDVGCGPDQRPPPRRAQAAMK